MAADLIVHNARFYTVDAKDSVAEAMAISDGRILATGSSADMLTLAGPGTRKVDVGGKAVIPGFVDGHPHMDFVGLRAALPSFNTPKSIDDVLEVVRAAVAKRKPGEWVLFNPVVDEPDVFAYPAAFKEGRWPNRHDLDKVSPNNPVYIGPPILVAPGIAIANTAAIKLAGITASTAAPPGVEIDVDGAGEVTGIFRDFNFPKLIPDGYGAARPNRALFPMIPPISKDEMAHAVELGQRIYNEVGYTAIYEGHGIPALQQQAYLDLWLQKKLSIRTYFVIAFGPHLFANDAAVDALIADTARYAGGEGFGDDLLKFGGLGYSFDSATAIGACLQREPYVGATGKLWHGVQNTPDEKFRDGLFKAARAGLRLQVQAAGGAAIDKVLGYFEEINKEIPIKGKRYTIEHCQFPSIENMETCKRLGIIATTTTNFLWNYDTVYLRCFGEQMSANAIPLRTWMDAGVCVTQSTDGRPYDPFFSFWQSLARRGGVTGHVFGLPEQKITRAEALRLCTYNPAYAAFWEKSIGSLEAGKLADFVVLSDDIMTIEEDKIPEAKALATVMSGKAVYDTGIFSR
ncbi:amidohydrolase [Ferrovibrio sp.]|uniref:amidohydrolase n=1 Tax=Ferrovibrio sp. TaxID=1917215 RepID=UPI0035AD9220